ncbi:pirin [Striga asiatica]|uniref:Pirin n=1 Tax=Striga asiatica TaxID=4170 RepID=A0A5A7Q9S6_STRAF|nr:pirin [Striga asiatica]
MKEVQVEKFSDVCSHAWTTSPKRFLYRKRGLGISLCLTGAGEGRVGRLKPAESVARGFEECRGPMPCREKMALMKLTVFQLAIRKKGNKKNPQLRYRGLPMTDSSKGPSRDQLGFPTSVRYPIMYFLWEPFLLYLQDFTIGVAKVLGSAIMISPNIATLAVTPPVVGDGGITHQDFAGHKGTIHAGEVQWMTAGRGIVHSEMPAGEGTNTGLQLWINLSAKDKMIEPRYQELVANDIPKAEKDGVEVKVIAGEAMGVHSPVYTRTPTMFLDFTLKPNSQYHQSIPGSWNAFVYIIEGEGVFGVPNFPQTEAHHILVLGPGEGLSVWNKSSSAKLRFILVGGLPLNEPVVQHGPFVMNSQHEIEKTIEDYYYGRNGFEMARHWRSN